MASNNIVWTATIVSNVSIAVACIFLYCRRRLSYWTRRGVEQLTRSHWLFGDFKEGILFRSAPGWHLGELHRRARGNTPFLGFYIFHKPCLLLRDPNVIKQILISDFEKFSDSNFAGNTQKDSIGMKNIFGIRNPAWKYLKQKIFPTLTKSKLKQMLPYMLKTGEPMVEYIEKEKSSKLDAQELSYKYATDLIACVALGSRTDSFKYPDGEFTVMCCLGRVHISSMPEGPERFYRASLRYGRKVMMREADRNTGTYMNTRAFMPFINILT